VNYGQLGISAAGITDPKGVNRSISQVKSLIKGQVEQNPGHQADQATIGALLQYSGGVLQGAQRSGKPLTHDQVNNTMDLLSTYLGGDRQSYLLSEGGIQSRFK